MRALTRVCVTTAMALAAIRAGAQSAAASPPAGLTLQRVLDAALTGNTQIRNQHTQIETYRGLAVGRAAPFDLQFRSSVQRGRDNQQVASSQFVANSATAYQLSVARQMRSGIVLEPSVQVTQSQFQVTGAPATGLASAGLGVTVPLLLDRGGAVSARAVTVAQLDVDAMIGSWKNAVMVATNATVAAYWSYVAAVARLEAQVDAEARARRLLDETTTLVEKQERAPADLQQLRANLAAKRSARILADQSVIEARMQLGTTMGMADPIAVIALPLPATDFPTPTATPVATAAGLSRLLDSARARRFDLAAQRISVVSWELELKEFRSALLPRLDLVMNFGYQGFTQGPGISHLIAPLYRNVPGLNATVQFRYDVSVANSAARSRVMTEEASLGQQRTMLRDIERQMVTDVNLNAFGVDRTALALRESEDAVDLFRKTVDNEKRKLQLGMNTLFDVLNAEDALTNAQLTAINNRRVYATVLAALRLATGTLVEIDGETPSVDAVRLLTVP